MTVLFMKIYSSACARWLHLQKHHAAAQVIYAERNDGFQDSRSRAGTNLMKVNIVHREVNTDPYLLLHHCPD